MALLDRDKAQLAYDNRPRLTPEQEARVKALKTKMRDEARKAEEVKANSNNIMPTPAEFEAAEKQGKKSRFWGAIWDAWKASKEREHELALANVESTVEAGKAQRSADEAIANNNFELGKQQIAADVEMAKSRNLAVGLGFGGAGGLGAIALANRPSQPLMYPMPAPAPAPVYPQPAPQQQYQQQQQQQQ